MKQTLRIGTCAATAAVMGLSLFALPALAQNSGAYPDYCRSANGHLGCGQMTGPDGAAGSRPYERWDNGSPAQASGSSSAYPSDRFQFPQGLGAYSKLHGLGR